MRAVVDTNLLISGLLWGRNPGRLLLAVQAGRLQLCLSEPLLSELGHVLRRPKLSPRVRARQETAEDILASVRSMSEMFAPADVRGPAELRDPKDLAVLACAVAGSVDAIITGDRDLLVLKSFQGIPIFKASEALKQLGNLPI